MRFVSQHTNVGCLAGFVWAKPGVVNVPCGPADIAIFSLCKVRVFVIHAYTLCV
jgi:hypothetical protein